MLLYFLLLYWFLFKYLGYFFKLHYVEHFHITIVYVYYRVTLFKHPSISWLAYTGILEMILLNLKKAKYFERSQVCIIKLLFTGLIFTYNFTTVYENAISTVLSSILDVTAGKLFLLLLFNTDFFIVLWSESGHECQPA